MKLAGTILQDSTFTIYDVLEESMRVKEGNCSVYLVTIDKTCSVKLPRAADYYGTYVFVCLTSTISGTVSVEASSGDSISTGATVVSSVTLSLTGDYILLFSSGLYWHELVCSIAL
jgi:hypothetical protein